MKVFKVIGVILVVLIGLYAVVAIIAPASLKVEQSTIIDASPSEVYPHVACFKNWEPWNPWDAMDSTNTNEFSEQACGVGAWYTWNGQQTGSGRQDILEATENEYIKCKLVFSMDPKPQTSEWFFEEVEEGTKVTWNFIGTEASFFNRPMNLIGEFFLEQAYTAGLASLKEVVESMPTAETPTIDVMEVDLAEAKYLLISGDVRPEDIADYYTENFAKIMSYAGGQGAEIAGAPSGFYFNWTDTLAKMAAAIPIDKEVAGTNEIEFRVIAEGKALQVDHFGPYDGTGPAHYAIEDYANENGIKLANIAIEAYVTDPVDQPDTSKWLTQIIYPISAE